MERRYDVGTIGKGSGRKVSVAREQAPLVFGWQGHLDDITEIARG